MIEVKIDSNNELSGKEETTLEKLAKGLTYKAIADETHRSEETVKFHAKAIREKLHAKSTIQALSIAIAKGWVEIKEVSGKGLFAIFLTVSASLVDSDDVIRPSGRLNTARTTIMRGRDNTHA